MTCVFDDDDDLWSSLVWRQMEFFFLQRVENTESLPAKIDALTCFISFPLLANRLCADFVAFPKLAKICLAAGTSGTKYMYEN